MSQNIYIQSNHCGSTVQVKSIAGGTRGRVGKVAEFQRSKSFDHLTAVSVVGSSPALATCDTSQVLLAGVSGGFPGVHTPVSPHLPIGSSL